MAEFRLQQKQKAQLSTQQIISSQLLQLPLANLEQRIYEELQENPLLEAVEAEKENSLDERERSSASSSGQSSGEHFFQAVQFDSFHEILLKQLALQENIERGEVEVAIEILGNLDSDGYFVEDPEVIVDSLRIAGLEVDGDEVEAIRLKILHLDPPGVAALDLRERLLVQLHFSRGKASVRVRGVAEAILIYHFDDFIHRRFERLVKKLPHQPEEIDAAINAIVALDPHPGIFQDEGGHYISPDFLVSFDNGELTASLNDRSALSVKVSDRYRDILGKRQGSKEDLQFIRRNMQRANDFASALESRRQTLLKVIESLMKHQYAFFADGPAFLAPLGMKTIAADTGLDISTISRAANSKYVQTRFGVFELKYFFTGAIQTDDGEDVSSKVIKQHLADMIEAEEPSKPLSDDRLTAMLSEQGFQIARRTVAKYREQMQIPVARLRKKIF
ncbi:RNA polymerase factor sigma-54 [Chlorobium phaeovibrioides]|uniref:RNA polymerase factor sigma-54 n=1 Tax=Chlorobium phaeovibrioides TaxID=1094 RepID=A0A5M8IC95_CHLPH|nr:RNA polymerase factor sigma-54 [Chlorobium phaeovibrioides]KAA6232657.1 RNA polymerase factor sigma-54 [Chlorobium phaeovibrioides]